VNRRKSERVRSVLWCFMVFFWVMIGGLLLLQMVGVGS